MGRCWVVVYFAARNTDDIQEETCSKCLRALELTNSWYGYIECSVRLSHTGDDLATNRQLCVQHSAKDFACTWCTCMHCHDAIVFLVVIKEWKLVLVSSVNWSMTIHTWGLLFVQCHVSFVVIVIR